jgi:hypothetical protein
MYGTFLRVLLQDRSYVIALTGLEVPDGGTRISLSPTTDREVIGEVTKPMGLSKQSFPQSEEGQSKDRRRTIGTGICETTLYPCVLLSRVLKLIRSSEK